MKTHLIIAAGNGGQEAADTAKMIAMMYLNWAKSHRFEVTETYCGWDGKTMLDHPSCRLSISGAGTWPMLRGETGVHRVVRISPYDLQKRRHTTFVSVIASRVARDMEKALVSLHRATPSKHKRADGWTPGSPAFKPSEGRTYMFDPMPYVKDYATNLTRHSISGCDEPQHTLAGNLDLFLLHRLASKPVDDPKE